MIGYWNNCSGNRIGRIYFNSTVSSSCKTGPKYGLMRWVIRKRKDNLLFIQRNTDVGLAVGNSSTNIEKSSFCNVHLSCMHWFDV